MTRGTSKWVYALLAATTILVVCSNADKGGVLDDQNAFVKVLQNQGNVEQNSDLNAAPFNLTGTWSCDDGGKYYIKQIGDTVAWLGESEDGGTSNVAFGSINGQEIDLKWMDVPKGGGNGSGSLVLSLEQDKLTLMYETGGFKGMTWTRPPSTYEILNLNMTATKMGKTNRSSIGLRPNFPSIYMGSNPDLPSSGVESHSLTP
jgi:hypothetical protein